MEKEKEMPDELKDCMLDFSKDGPVLSAYDGRAGPSGRAGQLPGNPHSRMFQGELRRTPAFRFSGHFQR